MTKKPVKMLAYISGGVLQNVLIEGEDDAAYQLEVIDADDRRSTVWRLTAQPADEYATAAALIWRKTMPSTTYVSEEVRDAVYKEALRRTIRSGDMETHFLLLEMRRIIGNAAFGLNVFDRSGEQYDNWAQEIPKETEDAR